jgi:hypothetical protein
MLVDKRVQWVHHLSQQAHYWHYRGQRLKLPLALDLNLRLLELTLDFDLLRALRLDIKLGKLL